MDPKLKNIIKESGNNLHLEVADSLKSWGWNVDLSAYYCDDITDKPREIDILAKKEVCVYNDEKCPDKCTFLFCLLIECKYFKNEIAFRSIENNLDESRAAILNQSFNIDTVEVFEKDIPKGKQLNHHYFAEKTIAKLYDTFKNDKERTQDKVFQAITQPIKSLIFFKARLFHRTVFYPLVVYSGIPGFYVIKNRKNDLNKLKPIENIIFGIKYSYKANKFGHIRSDDFYINFIHQNKLKRHLKMIEDEEIEEIRIYLGEKFKEEQNKI